MTNLIDEIKEEEEDEENEDDDEEMKISDGEAKHSGGRKIKR